MKTRVLPRPIAWGIVILLGMTVLLPTQQLPAQDSGGCQAVDMYDVPRSCTFLEEHGACLWFALDSHDSCSEGADGFWDHAACEVGVQVDLFACNLGLPWRLLDSLLR